jgi:hypothetical protein
MGDLWSWRPLQVRIGEEHILEGRTPRWRFTHTGASRGDALPSLGFGPFRRHKRLSIWGQDGVRRSGEMGSEVVTGARVVTDERLEDGRGVPHRGERERGERAIIRQF